MSIIEDIQRRSDHTWLLEPRDEPTTYVVMEETGSGLNPRRLADSNPGQLGPAGAT
jgi:hypothetical protein